MAIVNGKSGTFAIYTENASISGYVAWQETYDNATYSTTNKSTVKLTAYLHRTNIYSGETYLLGYSVTRTAYFGNETVTSTGAVDLRVAGSSANGTPTSGGGPFTQVYTASKEITHNADGDKSLTVGFYMYNSQSGVAGNSFRVAKTTANITLTTIPRATTPTLSATSVTMGNSITVTMNPASSTFKHKLRYNFGSVSGSATGFSIGAEFTAQGNTTATFTPPTSLGSQIPSAMSGTGTLICYTYASNGTHIGTKTVNITLNVPAYTPEISGFSLTGNNLLSSTYVQGKSTVTVNATAVTYYGATIKSISSVIDGKTYTGLPFTTSALSSGSKSAAITITDSRNKSATVTTTAITVYAYSIPNITTFTLARQSNGTTVVATVQGTIASVNSKNAKTIKVTLNGVTNTITSSSYTISGTTTFTNVPTDSTFNATASFADSYTTITKQATLPTVAVTMDFHNSGKGVALGKVSEDSNLFEVAWRTKLNNATEITNTGFAALTVSRSHASYGVGVRFANDSGVLGSIGMIGSEADQPLRRWNSDVSTSYIVLDTGNLTEYIKDYVTEQGTWNGWEYSKWRNGRIELFSDKSLNFPAGTLMAGSLWRSIVSIDLGGILTKIVSGNCPMQSSGIIPQVCRNGSNPDTAEIVIATSRSFDALTLTVPIYIVGKWK